MRLNYERNVNARRLAFIFYFYLFKIAMKTAFNCHFNRNKERSVQQSLLVYLVRINLWFIYLTKSTLSRYQRLLPNNLLPYKL